MPDTLMQITQTRQRIVHLGTVITNATAAAQAAANAAEGHIGALDEHTRNMHRLQAVADSLADPLQFKLVVDLPVYVTWTGGASTRSQSTTHFLRSDLGSIATGFAQLASNCQLSAFYAGVAAGEEQQRQRLNEQTATDSRYARDQAYAQLRDLERAAVAEGLVVPPWNWAPRGAR